MDFPGYIALENHFIGFDVYDTTLWQCASYIIVCGFLSFLAIALSVLLRFTASDYTFSILKLFIKNRIKVIIFWLENGKI
jgi:hypothetical protein